QIQLVIGDRSRSYSGEFNSSRLQESWTEVHQEATQTGETKTSSRQLQTEEKWIRVMDQAGKEVELKKLPLEQGQFFQWTVPAKWLTDESSTWVEIKWVDFFRN
ncbi:MAG: hypothetical protein ACKO8U_12975, partial [Pirellula sp.]